MSKTRIKTILTASWLSLFFTLTMVAAAPRTGLQDSPELPKPGGVGDIPDMLVDLISLNFGGVAARQERLKLSSLRGKIVLLDFFWSKCPHCEDHAPHIVQIYNQYKQRGFTVLGLATDRKDNKEDVASVKQFLQKTKINYPVGYMTTEIRAVYADPKDNGVPQMALFGTDGKMVTRLIGWKDKTEKELRQAIETQLARKSTPTAAPKPAPSKAKKS